LPLSLLACFLFIGALISFHGEASPPAVENISGSYKFYLLTYSLIDCISLAPWSVLFFTYLRKLRPISSSIPYEWKILRMFQTFRLCVYVSLRTLRYVTDRYTYGFYSMLRLRCSYATLRYVRMETGINRKVNRRYSCNWTGGR